MRMRLIIVGLAAIAALYLLARPSARESKPREARVQATRELHVGAREQLAPSERSRDQLNARLAELEARLSQVERSAPEEEAATEAAPGRRNDLSDADIATWMDDHLKAQRDVAATEQAVAQVHAAIALVKRPDLHVENLSCGERFCRASFYQDDGERPVVRDLYGAPPITGEGFTIEEDGGRVGVYFARNGERVDAFRDEALLASAP